MILYFILYLVFYIFSMDEWIRQKYFFFESIKINLLGFEKVEYLSNLIVHTGFYRKQIF